MSTLTPYPGRFDIHESEAAGPGFLYCAEAGHKETVAIYETLKGRMDQSTTGEWTLRWAERDCRSIQYFKLSHAVALIDIHKRSDRVCFHMGEEVQYSRNRDCTREWANFLRSSVPDAVGIAYNSTVSTAKCGQSSFVFWEDRMNAQGISFIPTDQVNLSSAAGAKKVFAALRPDRVVMVAK